MGIEFVPFVMVVLIVLIVTIGKTVRARDKLRLEAGAAADSPEAVQLRREVARLSERVQVLERVVTDPSKRLSAEIDALEDRRR